MTEADTSTDATPTDAIAPTSTDDAAQVADAVQESVDKTPATWSLDDNVPGQGEAPEWFKGDKYKTVAEQAKAYKELEGKFGAFTGAPEAYDPVDIKAELKDAGININPEDPMLAKAMDYAKELNMSQEGYSKLVNLYAETLAAEESAVQQLRADEMKALGHNAEERLSNLGAWASKNLDTDMMEGFQGLATSAGAVKTLERLVAMTRSAPVNPSNATPAPGTSKAEIEEMLFAKDDHGNRKMRDPEYAKMVQQKMNEVHGTEPYREQIGG